MRVSVNTQIQLCRWWAWVFQLLGEPTEHRPTSTRPAVGPLYRLCHFVVRFLAFSVFANYGWKFSR